MSIIYRSIKKPINTKKFEIKEYYDKRNTILIIRQTGGVGDILMSLMMFEDIKNVMPEARIAYALPTAYHDIVKNHPYIDEVLDWTRINPLDYTISYNISNACGKYEQRVAPLSDKNRSDIWANHCGYDLNNHNMHLKIDDASKEFGKKVIDKYRNGKPVVLFCPISAMISKNLDEDQMNGVVEGLKDECTIFGLHHKPIPELNTPTLYNFTLSQWLGVIDAADYMIAVDSGPFHAAGGLNKPTVAIFSWADGKMYGKWYNKFILIQRHRDDKNWSCGPCYLWPKCPKSNDKRKPCITEITSKEIVEATHKMFEKWPWEKNGKCK